MIWKKNYYDSLISCATLCDEFATECSRLEDIENRYRSIFLSLDCADVCRQVAMLYVRGSENTYLMAKACIEICGKCAQEVSQSDTESYRRVYAVCQQTISSCVGILEMTHQADVSNKPATPPATSFYGINLAEILYN